MSVIIALGSATNPDDTPHDLFTQSAPEPASFSGSSILTGQGRSARLL
jgi:hypothetical protein